MQLIPGSLFSEIANYIKKVTKELAAVSKLFFPAQTQRRKERKRVKTNQS